MTQKQSVVIIGGGPAGLTAAWELVKDGGSEQYDVTVLEATREFGGISRTVKHDGNRMDIGGHRFFSKDDRIMDWWKDVLPLQGAPSYDDKKLHREHDMEPGGPDPEIEDKVMLKRHRVSRIYWNRHFLDYPISLSANTLKAMGFKLTMVAGFSYLKSMVHKLPETNLENFYINRFGRKLYSMFFEGYTEKLWGRHPSEISADWGAQRVKGLSIMGVLKNAFQKLLPKKRDNSEVETSLIEEFWYPKLGPGQLWETVESNCEAAGVKVITDANVVEIRQKDGKRMELGLLYNSNSVTEKTIAEYLQSEYLKLGISMTIHGEEEQSYRDNMKAGNFDMVFNICWGMPYDPQSSLAAMRAPVYGDYAAQQGLEDKAEIDEAITKILTSTDEAERQELYKSVLTNLHEDAMYLPLTYECNKALYTSALHGVHFGTDQYDVPFADMYFE